MRYDSLRHKINSLTRRDIGMSSDQDAWYSPVGSDTTVTQQTYHQERIEYWAAFLPSGDYYACTSCVGFCELVTTIWSDRCDDETETRIRWRGTGVKCQQDLATLEWMTISGEEPLLGMF